MARCNNTQLQWWYSLALTVTASSGPAQAQRGRGPQLPACSKVWYRFGGMVCVLLVCVFPEASKAQQLSHMRMHGRNHRHKHQNNEPANRRTAEDRLRVAPSSWAPSQPGHLPSQQLVEGADKSLPFLAPQNILQPTKGGHVFQPGLKGLRGAPDTARTIENLPATAADTTPHLSSLPPSLPPILPPKPSPSSAPPHKSTLLGGLLSASATISPADLEMLTGVNRFSPFFKKLTRPYRRNEVRFESPFHNSTILTPMERKSSVAAVRELRKSFEDRGVMTQERIKIREDLAFALDDLGIAGPGIEIGVHSGIFAEHMLKGWSKMTAYHAIDPWSDPHSDENKAYKEFKNLNFDQIHGRMNQAIFRTRPWGERVMMWRNLSGNAASHFVDSSMAFIYVDGNHDYLPVVEDLRNYWPKLSPGGILAGHDYGWEEKGIRVIERATTEFALEYGLEKHITGFICRQRQSLKPLREREQLSNPSMTTCGRKRCKHEMPEGKARRTEEFRYTSNGCCPSFWFQKPLAWKDKTVEKRALQESKAMAAKLEVTAQQPTTTTTTTTTGSDSAPFDRKGVHFRPRHRPPPLIEKVAPRDETLPRNSQQPKASPARIERGSRIRSAGMPNKVRRSTRRTCNLYHGQFGSDCAVLLSVRLMCTVCLHCVVT